MCISKTQFQSITNKRTDEIVSLYYSGFSKNSFAGLVNEVVPDFDELFSDDEIETLSASIFNGVTTLDNMPTGVYMKIGSILENAVFTGFNGTPLDFAIESPAFDMVESLRQSTWVFSGAKTSSQILEIQSKIFDEKGFKRPYSEFKKDAKQIFETHNKHWLQAEHQTAIAQSRSASQWLEIVDGGLELLQYQTIGDGVVRPEHVKLDNIVKPVDSPFWDTFFPPNGWRCRCDVLELETGDAEITETNDKELTEETHPLFRMNPGKDKIVFSPEHPYFELKGVNERFKVLAKKNFNLPIPPPMVRQIPVKVAPPKIDIPKTKKQLSIEKETKELFEKVVPDNYVSDWGAEMPNEFWKLLKNKPKLKILPTNKAYCDNDGMLVALGKPEISPRWNTPYLKKKIVAHEFGHAIHDQTKEIAISFNSEMKLVGRGKPEFESFFEKSQKQIGFGGRKLSDKKLQSDLGRQINEIYKKNKMAFYDDLFENKYSPNEIKEMMSATFDHIGGLTNGKFGGGHDISYYRANSGVGGRWEVWAHSSENYFVGNELFKYEFPELYELSIEYIENFIKRQ